MCVGHDIPRAIRVERYQKLRKPIVILVPEKFGSFDLTGLA
jgi:hypothetical protein